MFEAVERVKDKISYQSALLAIVCGAASLVLAVIYHYAFPVIQLRIAEDQKALLSEVLNGQQFTNEVFAHGREVEFKGQKYIIYKVKNRDGEVTHHVIRGEEEGYSGPILFLIGRRSDGHLTGVRILSHTETPGLGDKIETEKSNWVKEFDGRSLNNTSVWAVKKDGGDFDQFSGATITPRSVVRGVHKSLLAFEANQDKETDDE